jgi:hypothetical protein
MKNISFHRIISYLLTERTIESYGSLVNKKFNILDALSGTTGWCDFTSPDRWGECTNVFQNSSEAEYLFRNLFKLNDIEEFENRHRIKITPSSIPNSQGGDCREFTVDTRTILRDGIEKKLKKKYPHSANGYSSKGVLLVGIFDPTFGGFQKDIEISSSYLEKLSIDIDPLFQRSSFCEILVVDVLTPFHKNSENLTYLLKTNSF